MKILAIYNFHRKGSASGDDQVFINETSLLEANGHAVIRYTECNDKFDSAGILEKIKYTFGMLWSFKNYKEVKSLIKQEKPDIVHIHTFFPLLSPSVLYAAKKGGCKVVATLHDTRFICPCATSLRGMKLCNECGDGHYFRMCKYGCFKNSRLQSLIVASIFKYHRIRKSFYKQIDKYICLNETQIQLLTQIGFEKDKIIKKYNFVSDIKIDQQSDTSYLPEHYVVFYGRIGEEKGVRLLMKIWNELSDIPLVIMGGGPLEKEIESWAVDKKNVFFLGYTKRNKCLSIVQKSQFVVFPSIWYEGCSMVEIETECLGKALIVTDLGFSSEAIKNGINGYKVSLYSIDDFVKTIRTLWNDPNLCKQLGENARMDYETKYSPQANYHQLIEIYQSMVKK